MFGVDVAEGLLELGDVAVPLLLARGVDPGLDVEPDLDQPWELSGVDLLERAAQTSMFVGAGGGVRAGAGAQLDAALPEVVGEVGELPSGRRPVVLDGPVRPAPLYELDVASEDFFRVNGGVAHGGVEVLVAEEGGGDVDGQAVVDGVGGEQAPEVVRGEALSDLEAHAGPGQGTVQVLAQGAGVEGPWPAPEPILEQVGQRVAPAAFMLVVAAGEGDLAVGPAARVMTWARTEASWGLAGMTRSASVFDGATWSRGMTSPLGWR